MESNTPIADALNNLGKNGEGVDVTFGASDGNKPTVGASVTKNLGKGWSMSAAAQWAKDQWSALASLQWRPK